MLNFTTDTLTKAIIMFKTIMIATNHNKSTSNYHQHYPVVIFSNDFQYHEHAPKRSILSS